MSKIDINHHNMIIAIINKRFAKLSSTYGNMKNKVVAERRRIQAQVAGMNLVMDLQHRGII